MIFEKDFEIVSEILYKCKSKRSLVQNRVYLYNMF